MKKYPQVTVRLSREQAQALEARAAAWGGSIHAAAGEILERYLYLVASELRDLAGQFSLAEVSLLADVVNGWHIEPHTVGLLWAEVADALEEGYAEKWQVDGPVLVARLRNLTYGQTLALTDALQRWWAQGERAATVEGFRAVGLELRP
ncbi:hypothetical protein [Calidithermus roseus]|uniref:Uncharacterized protein n=1 Tax=Calidithermus roseus TaxID=1644118 RepID=A0A399ED77_9DEIN|nr:hypothetical protein [Calidithermus roseus]RIH81888.1 hypothetical protein Mrose_03511 [Calidithermus roseus]